MKNQRPSIETPEQITQAAFRDLWKLWLANQTIGEDRHAWDHLVTATREICERSKDSIDPEFIEDFAANMLSSLDRINANMQKEGRV